ncbi:leucyl aminopeptidase [Candidatus Kaiserbacteria bacterium CG10_big_fil_rev_8_21_14_0_10_56_12]|uniref:Probable cytosol aminopeptidase n=1 Tax=Candidatus Kaiserbacteria bacterium CG10_big_fil_rev_8_21_14_0_10_56_12 TaxID=1974611 RepID=A0A2H0UC87_9BACT|nr:MAG: leucyl aminopeptidase [Candidatus Kaiserbacteria bacterium CG10_big_fil_rev_8_21_14_0_10_56_12]
MRILVKRGKVESAPKSFVRVAVTDKAKGFKRFVERAGIETLELGVGAPSKEPKTPAARLRAFRTFCRTIVTAAKANKVKKIALDFTTLVRLAGADTTLTPADIAQSAAENFEMANYEFNQFKTEPKEGWDLVDEVLIYTGEKGVERAIQRGQDIGREVNACRTLANTPGGDITPTTLTKTAKDAMKGLPVSVKTLGEKEMQKLGMGALLGVAKGSSEKPTFTILEYKGGKGAPVVLVGKGVTFDSGGLNLKPSSGIYEMHMDMSGAAAVIHAVALAARLRLAQHVIGLVPSVENMPGNQAYRPGDVLTSLSGKTIEVLNTDAEGRLILADALTYAKRYKPAVVVDAATLTGAAMVALGTYASGVMTRDDALAERLLSAAEESGDYAWRLPLWDEYEELVKGTFGDINNSSPSRYGGAIEGGMFLWQFAKELECPWAHLDIAPRMTAAPGDELAKGAAGAAVRLMARFIEQWA